LIWLFVALLVSLSWAVPAPIPSLADLQPRGLQIGGTTRIVAMGRGFDETVRPVLPLPDSVDVSVVSVEAERVELDVSVDGHASPGIYALWLATQAGLSNPLSVGLDRLPQKEYRSTVDALPVALYGRILGNQVLQTEFPGAVGQRVVVDVEAQRLGSNLRPMLRLYAPSRRLLAVARPTKRIGGDARLELQLPEAGIYRVELQDIVYQAADPSWFRLKIGDLSYADGVFPLAVPAGLPAPIRWLGGDLAADGWFRPAASRCCGEQSAGWPETNDRLLTGAAPRIHLSDWGVNELTESDVRSQSGPPRLPVGVSGCLAQPGEQDEYEVLAQPGSKLRMEVFADRWGSPLDALLVVASQDGKTLARADDQPGSSDPLVDVDVPADVSRLTVRVSSLVGRGGSDSVYRLAIAATRRDDPVLQMDSDRLNIPAGGRWVIPVNVDHRGAPRPLRLQLPETLDSVLTLAPSQLDATDEVGLVALEAQPSARGVYRAHLWADVLDASGTPPVCLLAAPFPGSDYQPHWRHELMIAVGGPSPLQLAWSADTDAPAYLAQGTTRRLGVQLQRADGGDGPARLSLVSSQPTPTKQVDNRQVEDPERALRLVDSVVVPAEQNRGELLLVTPADLPLHRWSFALQAELLGPDGQSVLARAFTPIRRWETIAPLQVALDGESTVAVTAGDESGVVLRGHVQRHPDFVFPVQLRLQGLAENDPQPMVTIPAHEDGFELTLKFAKDAPAREIKNVTVLATAAEPNEANRQIRAQSSPVTVQLKAAGN
jgi:hypothetical protein